MIINFAVAQIALSVELVTGLQRSSYGIVLYLLRYRRNNWEGEILPNNTDNMYVYSINTKSLNIFGFWLYKW